MIPQVGQIPGVKRLMIELGLLKFADQRVNDRRIVGGGGAKLAVRQVVSPSGE
ncbi:hypothetical protein V6D92_05940 [Enterobacter hormaechei]